MCAQALEKILKTILKPGMGLVVGVSGGPDSTALLDVLAKFSQTFPLKIFVAHVNHGLRERAADSDEKFVRDMTKNFGFQFFAKRVKLSKKSHIEENGRKVRREFFLTLKEKFHADFIVTAHTEDDQIETIVFNFLRGAGPKGLAGMEMMNNGFFKPFLTTSKKEILMYLKSKKLKFCKDVTNNDTKFRRNFLRKKVIPLFKKVNPSFRKTLLRNSEIFRSIDQWLLQSAEKFLVERAHHTQNSISFPLKDFEALSNAEKSAVIQRMYRRGTGSFPRSFPRSFSRSFYRLPLVRVQEVLRMLKHRVGKKQIIFGENTCFTLERGMVVFRSSVRS